MPQANRSIASETSAQALNRSILSQLDHVEYRLVTGGEDLEDIYRLRYNSFRQAGMLDSNPTGMLEDRWDDLPNSYRFAVYYDGELMSTIRLHHISREFPCAPAYDTFPEAMVERVANGETFIDGTRFAAYHDIAPSPMSVPFLTIRLALVASSYFEQTSCLSAIKPEHTAFYKRMFGAKCIAGPTLYPGLVVPRFLYETPCGRNLDQVLTRYPFMRSTKSEQRMLFGKADEAGSPLTILPTAKYARVAA
jgi:hypothetical protein